jgi:hypothetical protein
VIFDEDDESLFVGGLDEDLLFLRVADQFVRRVAGVREDLIDHIDARLGQCSGMRSEPELATVGCEALHRALNPAPGDVSSCEAQTERGKELRWNAKPRSSGAWAP